MNFVIAVILGILTYVIANNFVPGLVAVLLAVLVGVIAYYALPSLV